MNISIDDPALRLSELVRRVEAGEAIVLTRDGRPLAHITPVEAPPSDLQERNRKLLELSAEMERTKAPGPDPAHASDFLFDDTGMPG